MVKDSKKNNYVVMIPARGGSKSIHLKNIRPIAGQPLIYWSLDAAVNSKLVSKVYVSTDSTEIKDVVLKYHKKNYKKISVIDRSPIAATDVATTEDVMFDFSEKVMFENMVLIQCTNPLITSNDIDECIKIHPFFDSVISTVVQKRFYWNFSQDGSIREIGHDIRKRPRRQDWNGVLAENGSIYVISRKNLYKGKCRAYGRIGTYIMNSDSYFEIDEPIDWIIIETILKKKYGIK